MPEIIEMPKLSDTMTTGTLVQWLKQEGDPVSSGDMIAEVETDKATMEVECFEDGFLLKHYIKEGDVLEVGGPICAVGEEGEEAPEVEVKTADEPVLAGPEVEEPEVPEEEPVAKEQPSADATPAAPASTPALVASGDGSRVKASPLARKIADELGVDISRIPGSGQGGRIVKSDVEEAAKNPQAFAVSAGNAGPSVSLGNLEEKVEKVSNMRASIAKALVK